MVWTINSWRPFVNPDKVKLKAPTPKSLLFLVLVAKLHMKLWDSATFTKYTAITDEELDDKVRQIKL